MFITLYTIPNCAECAMTKAAFSERGINFTERSATEYAPALTAKGLSTTPVVAVAVKSELVAWQGHRPDLVALLADLLNTGPVSTDGLSQLDDAEEAVVTRMQVIEEIRGHQLNFEGFFAEWGNHPIYRGKVLLSWLGY